MPEPFDPLAFIESAAAITDVLATFRDSLVEKGWSGPGAEQAALILIQIGAVQGGTTPPKGTP